MSKDSASLEEGHIRLNNKQRLFARFSSLILVDLTVLNFLNEYWSQLTIDTFSSSFLAAIMLQFLLVGTFKLEHIVAEYFKSMGSRAAKFYRLICTYLILVVSKFVMLGAINFVLGDAIHFAGPYHGVATFVVVVIAIVVVEKNFLRILTSLEET
ncbi:MAG: hypothetical protein ACI8PP_001860 [Candidatus Pseudothioglobus sp.]|jgi:hypothetical protein